MKRTIIHILSLLSIFFSAHAQNVEQKDSIAKTHTLPDVLVSHTQHEKLTISKLETDVRGIRSVVSPLGEGDPIKWVQNLPGVTTGADGTTAFYVRGSNMGNNLFSLDGDGWSSITVESGLSGNWMMGLIITSKDQKPLPVQSYQVYWDDAPMNQTISAGAELTASHQFAPIDKQMLHNVKVAAIYGSAASDVKMGKGYDFGWKYIPTTGIEARSVTNDEKGEIYDLAGRKVNNASKGIYLKGNKKYLVK